MLNGIAVNQNLKPESSLVVRQERITVNPIHSQVFCFIRRGEVWRDEMWQGMAGPGLERLGMVRQGLKKI